MLIAEHLSKHFTVQEVKRKNGKKIKSVRTIEAVRNVSLKVEAGTIVGLLGINGAGKTTTIKMLSTLLLPSSGTIHLDGVDALANPIEIKRRINMVAGGERSCYTRLSARQNMEYFAALYGVPKKIAVKRIEELICLVGLEDFVDIPVERYSKGMKQRLQIARGMINDPSIIFFDEPTLGLDIAIARQMQDYLKQLAVQRGKGLLLTTHYIAEAEKLCDYVYLIDKGQIINDGTPSDLIYKANLKSVLQLELSETVDSDILDKVGNRLIENFGISWDLTEVTAKGIIQIAIPQKEEKNCLQFIISENLALKNFVMKDPILEDALISLVESKYADEKRTVI